jgi:hypothetical protein
MCCFSGPVKSVSQTRIFARSGAGGRQYVAYQMQMESARDVAMILPLPVPAKSMEGDVRFLDFKAYPKFFDDVERGFPSEVPATATQATRDGSPKIAVVDVGNFEASFVPTVADFERLDPRFRLPTDVWKDLPQYADYGFSVFQLKEGRHEVHPMVFDFPRRNPRQLFFPTVHIHDGKVHKSAEFDHTLYLQSAAQDERSLMKWQESERPAVAFVKIEATHGLVDPERHVHRFEIHGRRRNVDILV